MASLTHQWLLLSFCHRSSENPLPLLFDLLPNLHFHFTSALLPSTTTINNLLFTLITRCEVCPLFHFGLRPQSCQYACAVCPYTQLFMWHLTSETGWYSKKETCQLYFSHFPCLSFAGFFLFTFSFLLSLLGCSSRPLRCKFSSHFSF